MPFCADLIRQPAHSDKVWQIVCSLVPFRQAKPEDWKPLDFFVWKDGETYKNDETTQTDALIKSGESVIYWWREKPGRRQTKNGTYAVWEMREGSYISWQTILPISLLNKERRLSIVTHGVITSDESSVLIMESNDIVRQLNRLSMPPAKPNQFLPKQRAEESVVRLAPTSAAKMQGLTESQRVIVACLSLKPVHFDQIVRATALDVTVVGRELTMLELFDCVHRLPGNSYILIP